MKFYTDTPKLTHAPGLEVMGTLMARLGDPQDALRCVHIAGTNGKGSCAAMLAAMARAAGLKTGLFISPDLVEINERISVNGVNITDDEFAAVTARVRAACQGLSEPSYFEKMTAAAFLYLAEKKVDIAVLETGLGGRLDATNIIKAPLCSVIMPLGLDHTAFLGGTIAAVAAEKAGIIKPGRPVVSAAQPAEAEAVIRAACREKDAALHMVDITKLSLISHSPAGQVLSYGDMADIRLSLLGAHQAGNACAAIETARVLGLGETAVRRGLAAARWPCRFEVFPGTPPVILDGAHNGHGARALAAGLREYFPGQRFTMVMGVMADKDCDAILARMEPLAARFICVTPDAGPRALPAEALAARIKAVPAYTAGSLADALVMAGGYDEPICAFGSLYYIGLIRKFITEDECYEI